MDGLKGVVPYSCHEIKETFHQMNLFEETEEEITDCVGELMKLYQNRN